MITKEIDLQTLTNDTFVGLCHLLLLQEHGTVYKPVAGEGGDEGIDGFMEDFSIVYQIKFFTARPRPATFLKDIDKVANLPGLKRWVLMIPDDPTKKLYQLLAKEKNQRPFDVEVLGKTWILTKLNEYKEIRERFFPEIAKEASVQKILIQSKNEAQRHEKILKDIGGDIREIKCRRPIRPSVKRPVDSLSPEHIRDITDEAIKIEKATKGKYPARKIFAQLRNKFRVSNWHLIKDIRYGEVMSWLNRYYHGVNESPASPSDSRRSLQGVVKAQQKMLGLTDKEYRELLLEIVGKNSTTQMDIMELERVKYRFNILLSSKP